MTPEDFQKTEFRHKPEHFHPWMFQTRKFITCMEVCSHIIDIKTIPPTLAYDLILSLKNSTYGWGCMVIYEDFIVLKRENKLSWVANHYFKYLRLVNI